MTDTRARPPAAKDEDKRTGLSNHDVAAAAAIREKNLKERASAPEPERPTEDEGEGFRGAARGIQSTLENTAQARAMSIDPLAPSSAFDETLRDRLREEQHQDKSEDAIDDEDDVEEGTSRREHSPSDDRVLERRWVAPPGKRIAVPVRIEPKVYFAAERTFLVSACCVRCRRQH